MEIALHECHKCGKRKILWLRKSYEDSFYCTCSNRKMINYFNASFEDHFISRIRNPLTIEGLVELAQSEFMVIDIESLKVKLKAFNLENLSEQEFYDVVKIVLSSNDVFRFRRLIMGLVDKEQILRTIANVNPRIDIPRLREYFLPKTLPLSMDEVLMLENIIETSFYHPEIEYVTTWDELPSVVECFSPRMSHDIHKSA